MFIFSIVPFHLKSLRWENAFKQRIDFFCKRSQYKHIILTHLTYTSYLHIILTHLTNALPSIMASLAKTSEKFSEGVDFHYSINQTPPEVERAKGNYLFTKEGNKIFDGCSGAAVSCIGHGNKRVIKAIHKQLKTGATYLPSAIWSSKVVKNLRKELIRGTDEKLVGVYLASSGSEATETTMKLARQYFWEQGQKTRVNFIARERSYHGNTLAALGLSEFKVRQEPYIPLLPEYVHRISSCYQYRQQRDGELDQEFVDRKVQELKDKFQELGPDTVIAFVAEPVVGAALGCVPPPRGYLKAMKEVCDQNGALFILDEVMCGMGRTGILHAWQAEDALPDLQMIGKGLGAGYEPLSGILISKKVADVLIEKGKDFIHGLTFQAMPVQAAAALEVQRIIREENLLNNVSKRGMELEQLLKAALGNHPHVGDIRGRGLFWGIEFVKDKQTKEPFESQENHAYAIQKLALSDYNFLVYASMGCSDGINGDVIIIAPPLNVSEKDVKYIAKTVEAVVNQHFAESGEKKKSKKEKKMKKFLRSAFSLSF